MSDAPLEKQSLGSVSPMGLLPSQPLTVTSVNISKSLRDSLLVLFRHRIKVASFFLAVLLGTLAVVLQSPRSYTSEASILIMHGRESSMDPTAGTGGAVRPVNREWENEINSELDILKSRGVLDAVVKAVGPEALLGGQAARRPAKASLADQPAARAVRLLEKRLEIESRAKSDVIAVRFSARTPEVAQAVVTETLASYLEKHLAVHQTSGAYEFFSQQTDQSRKQLDEADEALRAFKNETGIASWNEQQSVAIERVKSIQQQLERAQANAASSSAKVKSMRRMLGVEPAGNRDAGAVIASKDYKDMQSTLLMEEAGLASVTAETDELNRQLASAKRDIQILNDSGIRMQALQRQQDLLVKKYTRYLESLEESRINTALQKDKISNISIVQPATLPLRPDPRNGLLKLLVAVLVGLAGGAGIALAFESLDHTLRQPEDIEQRMALPVLVSIPKLRGRLSPVANKVAPYSPDANADWGVVDAATEHFEILCDRILRSLGALRDEPVILGVTGCRGGDGVSSVAANLALTFARYQQYGPVLYVDVNPAGMFDRRLFGMKQAGAVEMRIDEAGRLKVVKQIPSTPVGEVKQGGAEESALSLPDSGWIREIRDKNYRFAVFDMPPLLSGLTTPRLIGAMAGVIVVVEAEKVRWEIAKRAAAVLTETKANTLGVVLNKRQFHVPEWLYRRL